MILLRLHLLSFLALALLGLPALAAEFEPARIDLEKTLWGVEYTFQDQAMVNESGRVTFETPHKRKRFDALIKAYASELGLQAPKISKIGDQDYKPGGDIMVPGDGKHVLTMEPVTIEMNTPPRRFNEIRASGEKIFAASKKAELVPYVNPAAERSGMGHIHVGALRMGDNPFFKHPNLLRNMMVYQHQHPSLMWGFAEAYDIGGASNITTLHNAHHLDRDGQDHLKQYDPYALEDMGKNSNMRHGPAKKQEAAFFRAVKKFDDWYAKALKKGDTSDGLRQYLRSLKAEGLDNAFYHYGMVNLQHLEWLAKRTKPVSADYVHDKKATVEFRNLRPPASPAHAEADAELLLTQMDKFSEPRLLVEPKSINADQYNRFHSASVVADDWAQVKKDLGRSNKIWDSQIKEYVDVHLRAEAIRLKIKDLPGAELRSAYSPKFKKGTKFELRIPASSSSREGPALAFNEEALDFQKVKVSGKNYWVAMIDVEEKGKYGPSLIPKLVNARECKVWFSALK